MRAPCRIPSLIEDTTDVQLRNEAAALALSPAHAAGAAGKWSKRQRTTAFEFLEERCCPSTVPQAPTLIMDKWVGGSGNLHSTAANWSNGVPNNTAQTTYDVEIPAASAVTMDINPTINNLTLDAASSSLNIEAARSFSLTGDVNNQGTINVGDTTGAAALYPNPTANGGTITLSGGGIINLNSGSVIYGYNNPILDNVDNTIQGQGAIQSLDSFENDVKATVDANGSGGTLSIQAPTTNSGTLEATASMGETVGGTLEINGTSVTNDTNPGTNPGTISTDALSTVNIISSTITDGNLTSAGGSVIHGSASLSTALRSRPGQPTQSIPAELPNSPVI